MKSYPARRVKLLMVHNREKTMKPVHDYGLFSSVGPGQGLYYYETKRWGQLCWTRTSVQLNNVAEKLPPLPQKSPDQKCDLRVS